MKRHKILIILPSYDAGGAENYALRLIEYAGCDIYDWHVTSGNRKNRILEPRFVAAGAQVHYASPGFGLSLKAIGFLGFLLINWFHAVMSLNGVFAGVPMALARIALVPVRIAWHRRSTPAYAPTLLRRLYARLAVVLLQWGSTRLLSNNVAALDQFHGRQWQHAGKYGVIPNGVDAARFRPRPEDRSAIRKHLGLAESSFVVGHVGRFDPAKDHETLFRVVREISHDNDNTRLLLVGTGTDSSEVFQRLTYHGISDITLGLGVRDDVADLYQAMDVFVFPSITEGQPNALIEAMLSGVPVVASDIATIRAAIPQSLHVNLFKPGESSMACKIIGDLALAPFGMVSEVRGWAVERYLPQRNFKAVLDAVRH